METNNQIKESEDFNKMVSKLKSEDFNFSRISKAVQILYLILIPLYSFITLQIYLETGDINRIIGGVCLIISYIIFAVFFRKYYKEYKYLDYSLPTIQMLKKAAYRYQAFQLRSIWIFVALVFADVGLTFNNILNFSILKIQIFYWGIIVLSVLVGLILWYFKYKPIRDGALHLIKEIEG